MAYKLDAKTPAGPLAEKWSNHKAAIKVVSPANKRKLDIIVVGTGLGGASAAASLGELGYNVKIFCISDSPRRAHSIAAQGGINAAKNYQNDNDSIYRLFYDTIKGGDYRARDHGRFLQGVVEVVGKIHGFLVKVRHQVLSHLLEACFGITHGRSAITVDGAEVTLAIYQRVTHCPILSHTHQRTIYGGISMRVIFTQHLTYDSR